MSLSAEEILSLMPQKPPFLFVDKISSVSEKEIVGHYTFHKEQDFYRGHFPGHPVTPGVLLLESMCQVGVVGLGLYLLSNDLDKDGMAGWITLFADAQVEFHQQVLPGEALIIKGERKFWRRKKLRSAIEMRREADGCLVAQAEAAGIGVRV